MQLPSRVKAFYQENESWGDASNDGDKDAASAEKSEANSKKLPLLQNLRRVVFVGTFQSKMPKRFKAKTVRPARM